MKRNQIIGIICLALAFVFASGDTFVNALLAMAFAGVAYVTLRQGAKSNSQFTIHNSKLSKAA